MAQTTKQALAKSLYQLMLQKPLNKITISDIAEECGINRMTFYYHFKDIYDLIEWMVDAETQKAIQGNQEEDLRDGMLRIFQWVQENRAFVMNIYHSISRERLETGLDRMLQELLLKILKQQAEGMDVSAEELRFITRFYRHAMTGILLDWVRSGMKEAPETIVHRLDIVTRGNARRALETFQQERGVEF